MSATLMNAIKKLQKALNTRGQNIVITTTQHMFKGRGNSVVNQYHIKQAILGDDYYQYKELFSSFSQIHIVYFLRDMWNDITGAEKVIDEQWEAEKQARLEKMAKYRGEY